MLHGTVTPHLNKTRRETDMSGHLTIEKIAELRRSLKREANMYQKSGNDHDAAHLRITADLLVKAEVALERVRTADDMMFPRETLLERRKSWRERARQLNTERGVSESYYYDYDNQCWIVDGKVEACAHPKTMNCKCYGKLHAGETATNEQIAAWEGRRGS